MVLLTISQLKKEDVQLSSHTWLIRRVGILPVFINAQLCLANRHNKTYSHGVYLLVSFNILMATTALLFGVHYEHDVKEVNMSYLYKR